MSNQARPAFGANHSGDQRIVDVRAKIADDMGAPENFTLEAEDIRLILHIRAIGYGDLTITVNKGKPAKCIRTSESIDYTKPVIWS